MKSDNPRTKETLERSKKQQMQAVGRIFRKSYVEQEKTQPCQVILDQDDRRVIKIWRQAEIKT